MSHYCKIQERTKVSVLCHALCKLQVPKDIQQRTWPNHLSIQFIIVYSPINHLRIDPLDCTSIFRPTTRNQFLPHTTLLSAFYTFQVLFRKINRHYF